MPRVPGYKPLQDALDAAYAQASAGKGLERHADEKPFTRQPLMETTRLVGVGFPIGQALKKTGESVRLLELRGPDAARAEILGAIVYLAAAYIHLEPKK